MSIELTEQQQHALDEVLEGPPIVVDPRTDSVYVLLPASEYARVQEILNDEARQLTIRNIARRNAIGRMVDQP